MKNLKSQISILNSQISILNSQLIKRLRLQIYVKYVDFAVFFCLKKVKCITLHPILDFLPLFWRRNEISLTQK